MTKIKHFAKLLRAENWSIQLVKHQARAEDQFLDPFDIFAVNYNSIRLIAIIENNRDVTAKIQKLKEWAELRALPRNALIQVVFIKGDEWEIITL